MMIYYECDLEVEAAEQPNVTGAPNEMHFQGIMDDGGNFYFPQEVHIPAGSVVLVHRTGVPFTTPSRVPVLPA
jgi:hypothetical protein